MFSKAHIIEEIKRTAQANGGTPLGQTRFGNETGIKPSDWKGKYWVRWSTAVTEAGFTPNKFTAPREERELLEKLASFTLELGHFPVYDEINLRARTVPGFPWPKTFERFGRKKDQVKRLLDFCADSGDSEVVDICTTELTRFTNTDSGTQEENSVGDESAFGYVYLLKMGRFYKVGRTNSVGRRERELAIQLPEKSKVVHSIKTDDAAGIEYYWHLRFGDRRKNGEWFKLTASDVSAFKRRKFM